MDLSVRLCEKIEFEQMVDIFIEMEEHYLGQGIIQRKKMQHYLESKVFTADSGVMVVRVEQDARVVGFACVSVLYPSARFSGQMFIKELFISKNYRGQGAGKRLMQYIAQLAVARECSTLDWMSEKSNAKSKQFYTSLGGEVQNGMYHFRLCGSALHQLADK